MTSNDIFSAIARNDSVTVRSLSTRSIDNLGSMLDDKQSTVLHVCCNSNNEESLKFFLKEFDARAQHHQQFYTFEDKKVWLNRKDNEGLTCLHYSVLAGNFMMTRLLEQHGADIYQINSQGQCVMHIAAQADSPLLLYYFLNKGFRIQVEDFKGSTPLHWACYSGRQNAVNALIAWGAELNIQDKNYGFTPLHLAVLSADSRITKKLLIRGANRYLKDFHNKVPLDIARQNQYVSIKQMIQDQFGFQIMYNLRQPYHKTHKRFSLSFFMVVFLLISTFVLNIVFVLDKIETIINIVYIIFSGIPWIFLLLTSLINPGYLKTHIQTEQLFELLVHYSPQKICFDCQILKPQRSKHCEICNSCVMVYDHHCPWVNNCIGAKNYIFFYLFIISMELNIISTLLYSIYSLIEKIDFKNNQTESILHIATTLYCTANSLFIIPLTILIIYSTRNCLTNTTTFQKYLQKSKQKRSRSSSSVMMRLRNHTIRSSALLTSSNTSRLINKPILEAEQKIIPKTLSLPNCMKMCFKNKHNQLYLFGN